jgi:hypothetical protein
MLLNQVQEENYYSLQQKMGSESNFDVRFIVSELMVFLNSNPTPISFPLPAIRLYATNLIAT